MKNKVDEIYKDVKGRIKYKTLKFTEDPKENFHILSSALETVNIQKGDLLSLDMEISEGSLYLMYLLQKNDKISFGICKEFKIWFNLEGPRMCCNRKGNAYKCKSDFIKCNIK
jgi:hypothetical protein